MNFRIFTLHPDIFRSFLGNSLIARGIQNKIIDVELFDWRQKFGIGNYKQVDDSPFGGGSGMVLMAEPIISALESVNCINQNEIKETEHASFLPNNASFFEKVNNGVLNTKKVNIVLTPRGFRYNQPIAEWISENFEEVNLLCGRYEGFDARVSDYVDLELSIGDFVLNGGEVGAMAIIESISRLVPGFITKNTSVLHDSFSSGLNAYSEFAFENGSKEFKNQFETKTDAKIKLFDNQNWIETVLPFIEHPQYTRPQSWRNIEVPQVLLSGDHSKIQKWRKKWY
jgi:tRNA (guanine37-N1)-methyltransferase